MTITDAMRALLGDGSVLGDTARELDLLIAADNAATEIQSVFGVLYSGEEAGAAGVEAAIERLAREHAHDPDLERRLSQLGGSTEVIAWAGCAAPARDLLRWHAQPHMRAAYYLGLAIGWRAARQSGGAR